MSLTRWLALLVAVLAAASPAQADAASEDGIRIGTSTFRTLEDALAWAQPGDEIVVTGGTHRGQFVVTTSVVLAGEGMPLLLGPGVGSVLTILAENVTVRGFRIEGSGSRHDTGDAGITIHAANAAVSHNTLARNLFGIWAAEASRARIENNTIVGDPDYTEARRGDGIRLWYSPQAVVRNNKLDGTRDLVGWYSPGLTLDGNRIENARYGLHLMYCRDARIRDNSISDSSVGIYAMSSTRVQITGNHIRGTGGYALAFKDVDDVDARSNILTDNVVGIYLDTTPFSLMGTSRFSENILAANEVGIVLLPAVSRNAFEENTFWDNLEHVSIHGGHASGANSWSGNYWSGFVGYDANGDGYSEIPYEAERLFERFVDRDPRLRALAHSPLADALDAAASAFPIVKPQPKLQDDRPRVMPHPLPFQIEEAHAYPASPYIPVAFAGITLAAVALVCAHTRRPSPMRRSIHKPALRIQGLSVSYGKTNILADASFELDAGEAVALWGENGAGKTTLLRTVLGLLRHEGTVEVMGVDIRNGGRDTRARIGYVPQEIRLEDGTVQEVVQTYAALRGARGREAALLVERLGLREHERKQTSALSGGLRQRLALALALLNDPPLLLLDEPTANLDAAARADYLVHLQMLRKEGKAILFTSHRMDEIGALASRVVVLQNARHVVVEARRFLSEAEVARA